MPFFFAGYLYIEAFFWGVPRQAKPCRVGFYAQTFLQSKKVTAATPHAESRLEVD
jgi:hypothetical protein